MRIIKTIGLVLLGGLLLAGCKTTSDYYGKGPVNLSSRLTAGFEKYKSGGGPEFFAVSQDGRTYGWSYCSGGIGNCRGGGIPGFMAVNACERGSKGVPCKIFARGKQVVWDGPVTYGNASYAKDAPLSTKSVDVVCGYALDYGGEAPKWTEMGELVKYAEEAKRRGLSLEQCDEIN